MTNTKQKWKNRESGIELLRLISMFLIVVSHMIMSLCYASGYIPDSSYVLPIYNVTFNWRIITLVVLRHSGNLGTTIFFICSAWFLISREKLDKKKWLQLFLDNWVISVLIFLTVLLINGGEIVMDASNSLSPFLYSNNWFITCYLIFLVVAPLLNMIIRSLSRKSLFRIVLFLSSIMITMGFVLQRDILASPLIAWFVIYFVIAYIKLYDQKAVSRTCVGVIAFLIGFACILGAVLFSEFQARSAGSSQISVLNWNTDCNPFIILMAFGLFILFRRLSCRNMVINYLASLTLFVYLIHENIIIRACYRPIIWQKVYENWGYSFILLKLMILSLGVFLVSILLSIFYDQTIRRVVIKVGERLYDLGRRIYLKIEKRAISE